MERIAGAIVGILALITVWVVAVVGPNHDATSTNATPRRAASAGGGGAVAAGATPTTAAAHDMAAMNSHLKSLFPNGDDRGFSLLENGQTHHSHGADVFITDPAVRAKLRHQLNLTMQVIQKYPTVKDAMAAGYRRAGPFAPGLGAHYTLQNGAGLNPDGVMDDADILTPLAIIYDGTDPDSAIAGFMYYSFSKAEPEGFAGPNDHWHYHTNICLVRGADGGIDSPYGADTEVSDAKCKAAGGYVYKQTQWMLHVWTVPAYTDPLGVFAHNSPALTCNDGSYYLLPESEWLTHPLNFCKAQ